MFCAPMPNGGPSIAFLILIWYQSAEKWKRDRKPSLGESTTPKVQVSAFSGFRSISPPVLMAALSVVAIGAFGWAALYATAHGLLTDPNGPPAVTAYDWNNSRNWAARTSRERVPRKRSLLV